MVIQFELYLRRKEIALECIEEDINYTLYSSFIIQRLPLEHSSKMLLPLSKYLALGGKP